MDVFMLNGTVCKWKDEVCSLVEGHKNERDFKSASDVSGNGRDRAGQGELLNSMSPVHRTLITCPLLTSYRSVPFNIM